jgi:hypothetical protein
VEPNGDRPRYFVLVYDSSALRVLSLSGLLACHADLFEGLTFPEG